MNTLIPHTLKRALDIAIALPLILLTLPVILLACTGIWLVDPGQIVIAQTREGRYGVSFRMWKLRTMFCDAPSILERYLATNTSARVEWKSYLRLERDPRLLAFVGKFLRRTSIDELPQLWNVLRGEMSLVGPRPFALGHCASLDRKARQERTTVMPGMTGLWQIRGRSDNDIRALQRYDLLYSRNWSIGLDLWILFKTIPAVLGGKGAY